jgi:hypothetical protein
MLEHTEKVCCYNNNNNNNNSMGIYECASLRAKEPTVKPAIKPKHKTSANTQKQKKIWQEKST